MEKKLHLLHLLIFSIVIMVLGACENSNKIQHNSDEHSLEIDVDSAAYHFVDDFIQEERVRASSRKKNPMRFRGFDSTYAPPIFIQEYFLDNDTLSEEDFFNDIDAANIKHFTKTSERRILKKPNDDKDRHVFSENGDEISSKLQKGNEIRPQYEFVSKINAYTNSFVDSRLIDIDHVDLHYSKHNVLYLSLGSSLTGDMNSQVYNCKTGEQITSYQNNIFNGSYYMGNGIINKFNFSDVNNLKDTEKIRVVTMIDDQFSFREFDLKEISE